MRILFAASEVHPFAKTGGLGDVAGALPRALAALGEDVAICLPLYPKVRRRRDPTTVVAERVGCRFAGENRPFRLLKASLPGHPTVPVYLIENPWVFEAEEAFYGVEPGSYGDGHLRFLYFSRAVLEIPRAIKFQPDVIHLNDWQTGLVAPLLRTAYKEDRELNRAATVLTIHNLAYQGVFPIEDLRHAGIPNFLLAEGRLLEAGLGNLLAGGIRFADAVSTVSRTYANEILTAENGSGLESLLHWRRDLLSGIVNGLDTDVWNPETDPHLPAHYSADDLTGKTACRDALLKQCQLDPSDGPIYGCVSRLVAQKGLELVVPVLEDLLARDESVRFVVLGSGENKLEDAFRRLAARFGRRAYARLSFDAPLSSLIEAGADFFLMPSLYEPCGLNQLISMRYGTLPIVRRVGGLRDTVVDTQPESLSNGTATGITFDDYNAEALRYAVARSLDLFHRKADYSRVQATGMRADWSWAKSAREYIALYREAIDRHQAGEHLQVLLQGLPKEPIELALPDLTPVPEGYARDAISLIPFDPWTLFCQWELGGEASTQRLAHFSEAEKNAANYVLRIIDSQSGDATDHWIGGIGRQWYARVAPGRHYHAEVYLHLPGRFPERVLDHPGVTMPGDVRPEFG